MPGMKRSRKRNRRSKRGGISTDNPAFKAKMDLVQDKQVKQLTLPIMPEKP
jgi:hypothetical protein